MSLPSARRFAFFTTFWGDRYADYLANLLLPSLLAPGNLPSLADERGHVFLLACPSRDWESLRGRAVFDLASRYVAFVHVPFEPPPPGVHPVEHMSKGQESAVRACVARGAIGSLLHPDMIFADGAIRHMVARRNAGAKVLLAPALRLAEEPLHAALALYRAAPVEAPISIRARDLVRAAVASLHDEIAQARADGAKFSSLPNCVWWSVGSGEGMLVHGFTWSPLMFDCSDGFGNVLEDLCGPIADGDYIARNFAPSDQIEFVEDSDDLFFASWTPQAVGKRDMRASIFSRLDRLYGVYRQAMLRRSYRHYTSGIYRYGDHVKAKGFEKALALKCADPTEAWVVARARARRWIDEAAGDLRGMPGRARIAVRFVERIAPTLDALDRTWRRIAFVSGRLISAANGDPEARIWVSRKLHVR